MKRKWKWTENCGIIVRMMKVTAYNIQSVCCMASQPEASKEAYKQMAAIPYANGMSGMHGLWSFNLARIRVHEGCPSIRV